MSDAPNKVLPRMLDRLFASMVNGPALNCRPHNSRQRVDVFQFSALDDLAAEELPRRLLGEAREATFTARVPPPRDNEEGADAGKEGGSVKATHDKDESDVEAPAETEPPNARARHAWSAQQALLAKLRRIAEDSSTYEQDTGVHVLGIGFPILSLPPGSFSAGAAAGTRRIVAPIAMIPVSIVVRGGPKPRIDIACRAEGADLVQPNDALLAWLESMTGIAPPTFFSDETGDDPWREIRELVAHVANVTQTAPPNLFNSPSLDEALSALKLVAAPRADADGAAAILPAAVLGLFPLSNQGLLRDLRAMVDDKVLTGPVLSFIRADAAMVGNPKPIAAERPAEPQRLVTQADPFQARAVRLSRHATGLVMHGPPGTGKSQTITNMIGDHLAHGQRVLVVCDKRTALDVVVNRLTHMGLGGLCAVVHDPQRDQKDLYRAVREQLDQLTETEYKPNAQSTLNTIEQELATLHATLTECHNALMRPAADGGPSFHQMVGEWLEPAYSAGGTLSDGDVAGIRLTDLQAAEAGLRQAFTGAAMARWVENPWVPAAGVSLGDFLSVPMDQHRASVQACAAAAAVVDGTRDERIPPFVVGVDLLEQAASREWLAGATSQCAAPSSISDPGGADVVALAWSRMLPDAAKAARKELIGVEAGKGFQSIAMDAELGALIREQRPALRQVVSQAALLEKYLATSGKWYGFLKFADKRAAAEALKQYGLALSTDNARRAADTLASVGTRIMLTELHYRILGQTPPAEWMAEGLLIEQLKRHSHFAAMVERVDTDPSLRGLDQVARAAFGDSTTRAALIAGLRASLARADAISALEQSINNARLFDAGTAQPTSMAPVVAPPPLPGADGGRPAAGFREPPPLPAQGVENWRATFRKSIHAGSASKPTLDALMDTLPLLEQVLRTRACLTELPARLREGAARVLAAGLSADLSLAMLRRAIIGRDITERLRNQRSLQSIDGPRLAQAFDRYRELEERKRDQVRDVILSRWIGVQRERLLAATGGRMNSLGADLRRRLTLRGERAMRLRQVISVGAAVPDGDPLFDVRPVWMASPETVAQLFPRKAMFDVVIFDEASQCRLEEALPVLTRGARVVIAGDPMQLPPTRFFESAVAASEDEDDIHDEQQLFEKHQSEVEDLLGAALGLSIDQCYLDVHYRSRHSDLIRFSNEHFYGSRLQPLPGHPSRGAGIVPISLIRVDGVYDKRRNEAEADAVCGLLRELLSRKDPPTIGVACFNLTQRDAILEKLDELAEQDAKFAAKIAQARERRDDGSYQGLFVKNLENVQGDERDHMIICTTYGPDPNGRFYQRFGPLGRVGGGRRLNVLVTRARQQVHLITSIPTSAYRALAPVPAGSMAGGGWLLYAYLKFAEDLSAAATEQENSSGSTAANAIGATARPRVHVTRHPSTVVQSLAERVAAAGRGADVYWGNDGFCIDLALRAAAAPQAVTHGVLCDLTRFAAAEDPVEWELFRTGILASQGWQLRRVWTPALFRDANAVMGEVLQPT